MNQVQIDIFKKNRGLVSLDKSTIARLAALRCAGVENCEYWSEMNSIWMGCAANQFYGTDAYRIKRGFTLGKKTKHLQKLADADVETVMYNGHATIIFWPDGTKSVAKPGGGDVFDPVIGYLHAFFAGHSGMSRKEAREWFLELRATYEGDAR